MDPVTISTIAFSVFAWIDKKRMSREQLSRERASDNIRDYLEWLNRQDHKTLESLLREFKCDLVDLSDLVEREVISKLNQIQALLRPCEGEELVRWELNFQSRSKIDELQKLFREIYHRPNLREADCGMEPMPSDIIQHHAFGPNGFFEYIKRLNLDEYWFMFFQKNRAERNIKVTVDSSGMAVHAQLEAKHQEFVNDAFRKHFGH